MFSNRMHGPIMCLLMCAGVLSGCATSQPESLESGQAIVAARISDVQADERLPLLDVNQELPGADTVDADAVRWGGTITRIENLAGGRTLLEIVSRPLRGNGRPIHNDRSEGRFVAFIDKFLDPEIVVQGRDITVVGTLVARQSGSIGETEYVFPVLAAQDINYWKKQDVIQQRHFPHWNSYHRHGPDPFLDLWILHRRPGSSRR